MQGASPQAQVHTDGDKVATLERALKESEAANARLRGQLERVPEAYHLQRQELELLRHRIFIAKAERINTQQMQLLFEAKEAEVEALRKTLDESSADAPASANNNNNNGSNSERRKTSHKPRGRRNLNDVDLPVIRCEVLDPDFEDLVRQGDAVRVGSDTTYRIGWQRGGLRKVVVERATYRLRSKENVTVFSRAELPPQAFKRCLAAPSLLAYVVHAKLGMGLPLYRLERDLGRSVLEICRGTMSRWLESAGGTLGATIIEAARREALAQAFCISTDATGILVQPEALPNGERQPCARGHFFVQIADRDHVFFEYSAKEDGESVAKMFAGFRGYVQADAKSVFNILYKPISADDGEDASGGMTEVGCFAHCRRKFWEAAVILKHKVAEEGLYRISRIYELNGRWRELPVDQITVNRREHLRPMVEDFFRWVEEQYIIEKPRRGLLRKALGYAVRHASALKRFLDDGRLNIDNNASERGLKDIAIGRKAWLFVGSDDHGAATGHLLSMIASARLHDLDPEQYLRDIFRVLGQWPRDRYIELSAKYWARTRARLDPAQLAAEVGHLNVPPPEQ